ncbi:hypothetical protein [Enterobacter ludwigii]|uniref:hypothetical protein n=1 Tax=Enterobacter ludwigii TaxID=299767 RepID=UPI003F6FE2E6
MQWRHAAARRGDTQQISADLKRHLDKRHKLSGGTIDRQFSLRLQQPSRVNFMLPGLDKLLVNPQGETLIFALGGEKRELAAVTLPEQVTSRQVLRQLNLGLGRLGIYAHQDTDSKVSFNVDEVRWGRVSQYLSVRGEGLSFSADGFTRLIAQAEASQEDLLKLVISDRHSISSSSLNSAMDNIVSQRTALNQHQVQVTHRIDDLTPPMSPEKAQLTAHALGALLAKSGASYASFSQALSTQGNLRPATVKNLLG